MVFACFYEFLAKKWTDKKLKRNQERILEFKTSLKWKLVAGNKCEISFILKCRRENSNLFCSFLAASHAMREDFVFSFIKVVNASNAPLFDSTWWYIFQQRRYASYLIGWLHRSVRRIMFGRRRAQKNVVASRTVSINLRRKWRFIWKHLKWSGTATRLVLAVIWCDKRLFGSEDWSPKSKKITKKNKINISSSTFAMLHLKNAIYQTVLCVSTFLQGNFFEQRRYGKSSNEIPSLERKLQFKCHWMEFDVMLSSNHIETFDFILFIFIYKFLSEPILNTEDFFKCL